MGSTKVSVINDFNSLINNHNISFLPAHPIAGLEKSGPQYGFAELFENRYCIIIVHHFGIPQDVDLGVPWVPCPACSMNDLLNFPRVSLDYK